MANSKHEAVMTWLAGCPHIRDLFFNFSQTEDDDTQLIPSESIIEEYNDGSSLRSYECALTRYMTCSDEPNDEQNIIDLVDFDKVAEWVEDQNDAGNFPEFPEGCSVMEIGVSPNESGYIAALEGERARYMIQFSIEYIRERK